jgi:hypothetical protein
MEMNWKFGVGQTAKEERDEINDARKRRLEAEYVKRQRWQRMREAETERKRERKQVRAGLDVRQGPGAPGAAQAHQRRCR